MFNPHLLVVSLGNPLPKYETLHSAGHFALQGLARALGQPPLREARLGGGVAACGVSAGARHTLVQSPVLMNVSGRFVAGAWRQMCERHGAAALGLVVVHDELERPLGAVSLLPWSRSARGHRGVKDVQARLRADAFPASPLARVAVGIGRPEARDVATVSEYVLRPVTAAERGVLGEAVVADVACSLARLEACWRARVEAGRPEPGLGWAEELTG